MGTHIYLNAVEDSNFTKEYLNELYKTQLENQIKFYEENYLMLVNVYDESDISLDDLIKQLKSYPKQLWFRKEGYIVNSSFDFIELDVSFCLIENSNYDKFKDKFIFIPMMDIETKELVDIPILCYKEITCSYRVPGQYNGKLFFSSQELKSFLELNKIEDMFTLVDKFKENDLYFAEVL